MDSEEDSTGPLFNKLLDFLRDWYVKLYNHFEI